jgi:hypothetical protein
MNQTENLSTVPVCLLKEPESIACETSLEQHAQSSRVNHQTWDLGRV